MGQQLQRWKNISAYVTFSCLCTLLALGSVHVFLWLAVALSFVQAWKQHSSQQEKEEQEEPEGVLQPV